MFEVCTHRDELSEGDHLLAFSDGIEELVLHVGQEPAPATMNNMQRSVNTSL